MALVIKEFDQMVNDTLTRIVESGIGITNTGPGSVIRVIVEAILSEADINNYNVEQAYASKVIDDATGEDLDKIAKIFGLVRYAATSATGVVTFSTTQASASNIYIQFNQGVSTKPNSSGTVYEAVVTDDSVYLPAGQLSVNANIELSEPGVVYLPVGSFSVITTSIVGIDAVTNASVISGGTDAETDDHLRNRIKNALSTLGKGTNSALENALRNINGVIDVMIIDMNQGVGTADAIIVTSSMPPSAELDDQIDAVIADTKAAGIAVYKIYSTVVTVNTTVTTTGGDNNTIGAAILAYVNSLGIADSYIISQMERTVLTAINDPSVDIATSAPSANVSITGTQVIKSGTITVNGVVYNG